MDQLYVDGEKDEYFLLDNIQNFIEHYFLEEQIEVDARNELSDPRPTDDVIDLLYLEYLKRLKEFNRDEARKVPDKKLRKIPSHCDRSTFNTHFSAYVKLLGARSKYRYDQKVKCTNGDFEEIDKMFTCLRVPKAVNKEILMHWMWTVKSSIFYPQRQKYYPFMLVLVGTAQGMGKSSFLDCLISPIEPFTNHTMVDAITDQRHQLSMLNDYIVVLDELARLKNSDINSLKRVLSMKKTDIRPLFSNFMKRMVSKCSFISTSNIKLVELINDPTGARRFVEIELFEKINFDMLTEIDWVKAWQAIDENLPRGYLDLVFNEVMEKQKQYVTPDVVEEFILFFDLNGGTEKKEINSSTLYQLYLQWSREKIYHYKSHRSFSRNLIGANVLHVRKNDGVRYFINKDSPIWANIDSLNVIETMQQEKDEHVVY